MDPTIHQHAIALFMWATILSAAFYLASALAWLAFKGRIRTLHARWFAIRPETVDLMVYGYLAVWKLGTILLFVVPWLAFLFTRP